MSRLYKDGKKFEPKPKGLKRKNADELDVEHSAALLLNKIHLAKKNIADEFLDDSVRSQKIVERAINLANLHPFEMLIKLASTVQRTLDDMKEPDYKLLLIKVRKNFSKTDVSDNTISNYFKQITGLRSTK